MLYSGAVANDAEGRKLTKYRSLVAMYSFVPVAVETNGAMGEEAAAFFHDIVRRIAAATNEPKSFHFLMQRLSLTVQRGNEAYSCSELYRRHSGCQTFYF